MKSNSPNSSISMNWQRILCAVDFSRFSGIVIRYGLALASRCQARLYVFHSVSFPTSPAQGTIVHKGSAAHEKQISRANEKIQNLMSDAQVEWEPVIRSGDPVEEAEKVVRETDVDLVITASYVHSGLARILVGTVVEQMAWHLPCPLLTIPCGSVRKHHRFREFSHILMGHDLSETSQYVLDTAMGMAHFFDSHLHILHAIETPAMAANWPPRHYKTAEQAVVQNARESIHDQLDKMAMAQLRPDILVVPGDPGEMIVHWSKRIPADVVIVGIPFTHRKLWVHSTTDLILRNAPCPVLTIPKTKTDPRCRS